MKAINFKIATFSFAAMLLASCSDSNNAVDNGIGKATTVVGSSVEAEYANQLASRVTNYKKAYQGTTTKTRALATRATTPEPNIPAGTPNLSSRESYKWKAWNADGGTNKYYIVPAGETDRKSVV